ncbi:MAG: group III truncated hemoglobin [Sphingopyxis terrae]|nr:group III truncated hemoglobin [Sphingopyxis terrae]
MKKTVPAHPHAIAAREDRRAAAIAMGVDEAFIATLVDRFYAAIRRDALLGPIFDEHIHDWPAHLAQMNRFWQSILLGAGNFTGNPMAKHLAIPTIGERHFQHWLGLFYATLRDVAPSEGAVALVGARARMIAESLLTGIAVHRDRDPDITRRIVLPHV